MSNRNSLYVLAVSSALALAGGMTTSVAAAAAAGDMEQCAGIIKAGKNDCATKTNACHGHVEKDATADAWIYLPKGTCDRLAGGHLVKVKEPKK